MSDYEHLALARPLLTVQTCWLCGIRLPVTQLMPDGDSARRDVRWYCDDVRACTERWTTRPARLVSPVPAPG